MRPLDEVLDALSDRSSLAEPYDEARGRRNWEAVADRDKARSRSRWLRPAVALGIAALALIAWQLVPTRVGPLRLASGAAIPAGLVGDVSLDDGSSIRVRLNARLELIDDSPTQIRWWLRAGRIDVDVVPGGPRRWLIETGRVTVEVLGTAFEVERIDDTVRVSVARGHVLVRGEGVPDGMRRLGAGESITVGAPAPIVSRAPMPDDPHATAPLASSTPQVVVSDRALERARHLPARVPDPTTPQTPTLEPLDPPTDVPHEPSATERLREADALRARGEPERAVEILDAISRDETAGSQRALAALTMARIDLDRLHRFQPAAESFARAVELGLPPSLAEDARARRIEALLRIPDTASARDAAREYLRSYPTGRHRAQVQAWIDTL